MPTTSESSPCCIAGMTRFTAMRAAPRTPHRTLVITEIVPALPRQSEGDNVGARCDGDVLVAVELVGHRGGLPELVRGPAPERFSGHGIDRHQRAVFGAEDDEAGGGGERAAPGLGRARLWKLPFDGAGLDVDGAEDALRLHAGLALLRAAEVRLARGPFARLGLRIDAAFLEGLD